MCETVGHLESLMASAVTLGSRHDYETFMQSYVRVLASDRCDRSLFDARLREFCEELLHPSRNDQASDQILGISKRALLRDRVLPVLAANVNLQRLVADYTMSLKELTSSEQP